MADTARRLAAILATDIAGYSRLMGADEDGTLARLKSHRRELIDPTVAEHKGRIVKTTGDGALVEFASTVDAVRCALAIQRAMPARNQDLPADRRIEFRIGINVGDIMVDGDDIYGDGVNVAARLEGLAEPGGICVSDVVHQQVNGRIEVPFVDMGEQNLKNIARPVRVYAIAPAAAPLPTSPRLRGEEKQREALRDGGPEAAPALALPDKPSIAVLPFQNMSGDAEQDYFVDGTVEDIITGLSRINWLFVIARNSSFVYKGKSPDIRQVGRELGVRYVLEGSVRKAGNRVRITGQLIEAETGAHLWADKFDGALEDIFDLQDKITATIVGIIEPNLRRAEIERARRKRPENLDAYDLYLRALPHSVSLIPADARVAIELLEQSVARDPNYAPAHALLGWCHEICFLHDGFKEADKVASIRHAQATIAVGTDDAAALAITGVVLVSIAHDRPTALSVIDRALLLNDSCATALYFGAQVHAWSGNAAIATDLANRALRLSPFDLWSYVAHQAIGIAGLIEERYADAASSFAKGIQANPRFVALYAWRATALALAGQFDEGNLVVQRLLELEPHFRCRLAREVGLVPAIAERFYGGLRQLGLPE